MKLIKWISFIYSLNSRKRMNSLKTLLYVLWVNNLGCIVCDIWHYVVRVCVCVCEKGRKTYSYNILPLYMCVCVCVYNVHCTLYTHTHTLIYTLCILCIHPPTTSRHCFRDRSRNACISVHHWQNSFWEQVPLSRSWRGYIITSYDGSDQLCSDCSEYFS